MALICRLISRTPASAIPLAGWSPTGGPSSRISKSRHAARTLLRKATVEASLSHFITILRNPRSRTSPAR
eukprot:6455494-Amphidinium_carterae.3